MRPRRENDHEADKKRRQKQEDDVLRWSEVDWTAGDVHIPRRQRHLTRPLAGTFPTRKLEVLRVRDVRHDDVRRAKGLMNGSGRLLRYEEGSR